MPEIDWSVAAWRKSSRSNTQGECVEVAAWRKSSRSNNEGGACVEVAPRGHVVGVRDSKDLGGPVLAFDSRAWHSFTTSIRARQLYSK